MHSHPRIALDTEQRAIEERFGISDRGTSAGWQPHRVTLGDYFQKARQTIARLASTVSVRVRRKQTNLASSHTVKNQQEPSQLFEIYRKSA